VCKRTRDPSSSVRRRCLRRDTNLQASSESSAPSRTQYRSPFQTPSRELERSAGRRIGWRGAEPLRQEIVFSLMPPHAPLGSATCRQNSQNPPCCRRLYRLELSDTGTPVSFQP